MQPTDDTIGPPDFMQSLLSLPEDQFASALGYDPEVFSWLADRVESLFLHSVEVKKNIVFGTMKEDSLVFLIFPAGQFCKPEIREFRATNPSYFDSTLGLQMLSEQIFHQTCSVIEEFDGAADLVLIQFMMGLITFETAKRHSFEQSVRHMPA